MRSEKCGENCIFISLYRLGLIRHYYIIALRRRSEFANGNLWFTSFEDYELFFETKGSKLLKATFISTFIQILIWIRISLENETLNTLREFLKSSFTGELNQSCLWVTFKIKEFLKSFRLNKKLFSRQLESPLSPFLLPPLRPLQSIVSCRCNLLFIFHPSETGLIAYYVSNAIVSLPEKCLLPP